MDSYSKYNEGLAVTLEQYEEDIKFKKIVRSERTSPIKDALLRLKDRCPQLTEILFKKGVGMSREAFDIFTSLQHTYSYIKKIVLDMGDEYELTRDLLAKLDGKCPQLQIFNLTLKYDDEFSAYNPQYQLPYQPLYFKNLIELSVWAFGNQADKLLDYMAISNAKLTKLTFTGMTIPSEMISWIGNCKHLTDLVLRCPYLTEDGLMELKNMHSLQEVHFEAKHLHWEPDEIIEFARHNKRLKLMHIEIDQVDNNSMQFDENFKDKFDELVRERRNLRMKVRLAGKREIEVSETEFSEIQLCDSEDDESDTCIYEES